MPLLMKIITIKTIKELWEKKSYRDSEQSLRAWYSEVKENSWKSSNDLKRNMGMLVLLEMLM